MSTRYLRLASDPLLRIQAPQCDACECDVHDTGWNYTCPSCGSTWSLEADDGEAGQLRDDLTGQTVLNSLAWQAAAPHLDPDEREAQITKLGLAITGEA